MRVQLQLQEKSKINQRKNNTRNINYAGSYRKRDKKRKNTIAKRRRHEI